MTLRLLTYFCLTVRLLHDFCLTVRLLPDFCLTVRLLPDFSDCCTFTWFLSASDFCLISVWLSEFAWFQSDCPNLPDFSLTVRILPDFCLTVRLLPDFCLRPTFAWFLSKCPTFAWFFVWLSDFCLISVWMPDFRPDFYVTVRLLVWLQIFLFNVWLWEFIPYFLWLLDFLPDFYLTIRNLTAGISTWFLCDCRTFNYQLKCRTFYLISVWMSKFLSDFCISQNS
jgi:hypothetical protein